MLDFCILMMHDLEKESWIKQSSNTSYIRKAAGNEEIEKEIRVNKKAVSVLEILSLEKKNMDRKLNQTQSKLCISQLIFWFHKNKKMPPGRGETHY